MEEKKNIAIILMAGRGERFSSETPKQFIKVNNQELFMYCTKVFASHPMVDEFIFVVPEGYESHTLSLVLKEIHKKCVVIPGGESREESAYEAIKYLSENEVNPDSIVLIHDADRPLVSYFSIDECIKVATEHEIAILATPSTDSVAISKDGEKIGEYAPRKTVYLVQTPQAFKFSLIYEAFVNAKEPLSSYTDEGSLVLDTLGREPHLVVGDNINIKVTFEHDIDILNED